MGREQGIGNKEIYRCILSFFTNQIAVLYIELCCKNCLRTNEIAETTSLFYEGVVYRVYRRKLRPQLKFKQHKKSGQVAVPIGVNLSSNAYPTGILPPLIPGLIHSISNRICQDG